MRGNLYRCAIVTVFVGLWIHAAGASAVPAPTAPRFSILPFDNLSPYNRYTYLGRAIAEMVTAEFSQIPQIILVEREKLESVTREIALGLSGMVDETTAPRVGALLGAQYLMTGTCVVRERDVHLTYKVIQVDKGTVTAAGAVEGSIHRITRVVKRLCRESLTRMASAFRGSKHPPTIPLPGEDIDDSVSVDDAAALGEAVDLRAAGEYEKAAAVLRGLVGRRPRFTYARDELNDLEKRLARYDQVHRQALDDRAKEAPTTYVSFVQTAANLMASMQYSKLLEYCQTVQQNPPPAPEGSMVSTNELAHFYIVVALYGLKRWADLLGPAENFVRKYPSSSYYNAVRSYLQEAMGEMREYEAKRANAETAAASLQAELDTATADTRDIVLFKIAMTYFGAGLYESALPWFRRINLAALERTAGVTGDNILYSVFVCYHSLRDRNGASRVLKTAETLYPQSSMLQAMRSMLTMVAE